MNISDNNKMGHESRWQQIHQYGRGSYDQLAALQGEEMTIKMPLKSGMWINVKERQWLIVEEGESRNLLDADERVVVAIAIVAELSVVGHGETCLVLVLKSEIRVEPQTVRT